MISTQLTLETATVLLRPMVQNDYENFLQLTQQDVNMWEFFSANLSDANQLKSWMDTGLKEREEGKRIPFTIVEKISGAVAGSSSFGNISYYDKRVEIGGSWLGENFRGTQVNFNAKFLMMSYAFEAVGFERVEFKTGVLNRRARRGLEKIGGYEEGTLRSHSLLWNGHRRTSVMYSVLKDEWPKLKATIFAHI